MTPAVRELGYVLEQQRLSAARTLFGSGLTEMSALEWLFLAERTPTQLAERLHLTTASVTGLVDRLAAQQLVDRRPHPRDRRKILVALTEQARARMADWFSRLSAVTDRATDHLDPPLRRELVDSLQRITAEIRAASAGDAGEPSDGHQLADTLHRISTATNALARPGSAADPIAEGESDPTRASP